LISIISNLLNENDKENNKENNKEEKEISSIFLSYRGGTRLFFSGGVNDITKEYLEDVESRLEKTKLGAVAILSDY